MKILIELPDKEFTKYLGDASEYLLKSIDLTIKQDELIKQNKNGKNTKEIINNFKKINETIIIYEFLKSLREEEIDAE